MKLTLSEIEDVLIKGTGTEFGIHRYLTAAECGRKGQLQQLMKAGGLGLPTAHDKRFGANVGTLYHRLLAQYHGETAHDLPESIEQLYDGEAAVLNPIWQATAEAWRIFRFYREHHRPDHWGRVLAIEVPLSGRLPGFAGALTGQADLVVETAEGVEIVDHKQAASAVAELQRRYLAELQPPVYLELYRQTTGVAPAFLRINQVTRHKELTIVGTPRRAASVSTAFAPFPDEQQLQQIATWLTWAAEQEEVGRMNFSACVGPYGVCPFFLKDCERL